MAVEMHPPQQASTENKDATVAYKLQRVHNSMAVISKTKPNELQQQQQDQHPMEKRNDNGNQSYSYSNRMKEARGVVDTRDHEGSATRADQLPHPSPSLLSSFVPGPLVKRRISRSVSTSSLQKISQLSEPSDSKAPSHHTLFGSGTAKGPLILPSKKMPSSSSRSSFSSEMSLASASTTATTNTEKSSNSIQPTTPTATVHARHKNYEPRNFVASANTGTTAVTEATTTKRAVVGAEVQEIRTQRQKNGAKSWGGILKIKTQHESLKATDREQQLDAKKTVHVENKLGSKTSSSSSSSFKSSNTSGTDRTRKWFRPSSLSSSKRTGNKEANKEETLATSGTHKTVPRGVRFHQVQVYLHGPSHDSKLYALGILQQTGHWPLDIYEAQRPFPNSKRFQERMSAALRARKRVTQTTNTTTTTGAPNTTTTATATTTTTNRRSRQSQPQQERGGTTATTKSTAVNPARGRRQGRSRSRSVPRRSSSMTRRFMFKNKDGASAALLSSTRAVSRLDGTSFPATKRLQSRNGEQPCSDKENGNMSNEGFHPELSTKISGSNHAGTPISITVNHGLSSKMMQ